jgi:hypothetical protein
MKKHIIARYNAEEDREAKTYKVFELIFILAGLFMISYCVASFF